MKKIFFLFFTIILTGFLYSSSMQFYFRINGTTTLLNSALQETNRSFDKTWKENKVNVNCYLNNNTYYCVANLTLKVNQLIYLNNEQVISSQLIPNFISIYGIAANFSDLKMGEYYQDKIIALGIVKAQNWISAYSYLNYTARNTTTNKSINQFGELTEYQVEQDTTNVPKHFTTQSEMRFAIQNKRASVKAGLYQKYFINDFNQLTSKKNLFNRNLGVKFQLKQATKTIRLYPLIVTVERISDATFNHNDGLTGSVEYPVRISFILRNN